MDATNFDARKIIRGKYSVKMRELQKAGRRPSSPADIMDARNAVPTDHHFWYDAFDTDFGIAGTEKNIFLFPQSPHLSSITPETTLLQGGLYLGDNIFGAKIYNIKDVIVNRDMTEKEARESPILLDLADGNQLRLDNYVENAFRFAKDQTNGNTAMMRILVPSDEKTLERAVVVGGSNIKFPFSGYGTLCGLNANFMEKYS